MFALFVCCYLVLSWQQQCHHHVVVLLNSSGYHNSQTCDNTTAHELILFVSTFQITLIETCTHRGFLVRGLRGMEKACQAMLLLTRNF